METVIVGLIGALAGTAATLLTTRTARHQTQVQMRAEHARLRLERRDQAYQTFAATAHALKAHLDALLFEPIRGEEWYQGEFAARAVELGGKLDEARLPVISAGPPEVDRAAEHVQETFRRSLGVFRMHVAAMSHGDGVTVRTSPGIADLRTDLSRVEPSIVAFLRCAQAALSDDGTRPTPPR
ncbi:hypothetical protein ABZ915_21935 [Streptomyces sp. NPDC046915]|uniref:hypothetical protein n=1 Tax=Streptomyces sp. NPDC046915 TaxID=3155257 RepID=UPI0033DFEC73